MEFLEQLEEKLSLNSFDVGSAYWVDVTHINTPHSFFVRPTMYRMHMSAVQAEGDGIDPSEIQLQTLVIFKSKTIQKNVRGRICFIEDDGELKCDVFALDYGFLDKSVPLKCIRKPFHDNNTPALATHCKLADCKPHGDTWTEEAVEAMKCYVGNERAKIIVRENAPDALVVEMINTCPDDIATMLALTGYSVFGYNHNVINRFSVPPPEKHYFTFKKPSVGDVLRVRLQTGKSLTSFYVAEAKHYKQYLNEKKNLTFFSAKLKDLPAEDLKKDKAVSVFMYSDLKYERGVIKEVTVPESRARVQLVDWGNIIEVKLSELKPMSEKFFFYPAAAMFCSVDESQLWDNELLKVLYPGFEFLITVKEVGDKFERPNIVTISTIA